MCVENTEMSGKGDETRHAGRAARRKTSAAVPAAEWRKQMREYTHRVQYYETDRMGITHHSNYIRWMEEARIDFLDQLGWSYRRLEETGIMSPVIAVDCRYRTATTFDDRIRIQVGVKEFRGVKLTLAYTMTRETDGALVLEGTSEHCFLDAQGRPVRLKKEYPEFYRALEGQLPENRESEQQEQEKQEPQKQEQEKQESEKQEQEK